MRAGTVAFIRTSSLWSQISPHLSPRHKPTIVFSRDDTSGSPTAQEVAGARVLIVEDEFLIASDLEVALTEAGIEVAGVATSADQAVDIANAERPTLAIMDIRLLGDRDGVDAALELFRVHGIRCVFASAHADEDTRARAQPAHPIAWVPKPYAMSSLLDAVRNALKRLPDEGE
jgi:two-component system, response regulator PdtaR